MSSPPPKSALIVFAKLPTAGTVKTRMEQQLGVKACLRLHEAMVRQTAAVVSSPGLSFLDRSFYFTGTLDEAHRAALALDIPPLFSIDHQFGSNLSERLEHALAGKFNEGFQSVIFLGTDCPLLSVPLLQTAQEKLAANEVVIGPTADGGYYLIGFSAFAPAVLRGISWGTGSVFQETQELLDLHSLKWSCLEPLNDLDRVEDLENIVETLARNEPWLQEAANRKLYDVIREVLSGSTLDR